MGACGLIFTFTTGVQTTGAAAAGGAAAGGAVGASGGAAVGASGGGRVGAAGATAGSTAGGRTTGTGTTAQGQGVTTLPGQTVSVTPPTTGAQGQPSPAAPATAGTTISAPANAAATGAANTPGLGTTATTTTGFPTATTTAAGTTLTTVPFNSLPAPIQSQIAAQLPAGAQLGSIIAENTPQGTIYRAQVMQNGVLSEMALNGIGASAGTLANTANNAALNAANTAGTANGLTSGGFVVGTPYGFEQLPAPVQTAFSAQGATGVTNVTWTPSGNGGVFRAMADGKPVEVRVGPNGQILPRPNRAIASNTTTNTTRLEDLPVAVRDAIRKSVPYAEITSISKAKTASGDVYDITMRANDRLSTMQISENGTIIRENRDIAAAVTADAAAVLTNEPPKLAWNSLPTAVRDGIEVQTQPDTIKTLALTNYLGKTAYVVDYVDKDAIRNRLYLNKEGLVVDTQTNIFGIAMNGKPVVIDDLPAPARAAVQQQAEHAAVTRIDLAMYGLTPVYVVTYQRNGEAHQMVVSREGKRMEANVGAPATTVIGSEKATSEMDTKAAEPQK